MARYKDSEWDVSYPIHTSEQAILCVLMDIRDHLRELRLETRAMFPALNTLQVTLRCSETQAIPRLLRDIKKNTTKAKRRKR